MILVVSHPGDDHATAVLAALERVGHPTVLLDTGQFPRALCVTQRFENGEPSFVVSGTGFDLDFRECGAAWWRRPQPFGVAPDLASDAVSFAYSECHEAIAGLWAALDVAWVNPPALDEAAHHKSFQLTVAQEVGLPIPPTVITNDPDVAQDFIAGRERTVYKTFLATEEHWRETRIVRSEELGMLDRVRLAPVIFQEYIPALADLRVTVIRERMFATAISPAPGGYQIDYRMDLQGARFEPAELSAGTERGIRALMDRLGLVYGAVDLRRMTDGTEVFLEINPAGEWRFVEERTGQPLTKAMAELLVGLDAGDGRG